MEERLILVNRSSNVKFSHIRKAQSFFDGKYERLQKIKNRNGQRVRGKFH